MIAFPLISFIGYATSAFLPTYFMETFDVSKTIAGRNLGLQSAIAGFLGLLFGGLFYIKDFTDWITEIGDILTRFSGFTIGCIMTGVIWIAQPESFLDVILYDLSLIHI